MTTQGIPRSSIPVWRARELSWRQSTAFTKMTLPVILFLCSPCEKEGNWPCQTSLSLKAAAVGTATCWRCLPADPGWRDTEVCSALPASTAA